MALKLTRTASETLNDIILHTLQEQGIEKAEALEQEIFGQLEQLSATTDNLDDDTIKTVVSGSTFSIVYKQAGDDCIVLTIAHSSRLAKVINS